MSDDREILLFTVSIFTLPNIGYGGKIRKAEKVFGFIFVFDGVVKVVNQQGKRYGRNERDEQAKREVFDFFGPNRIYRNYCGINDIDVADG